VAQAQAGQQAAAQGIPPGGGHAVSQCPAGSYFIECRTLAVGEQHWEEKEFCQEIVTSHANFGLSTPTTPVR